MKCFLLCFYGCTYRKWCWLSLHCPDRRCLRNFAGYFICTTRTLTEFWAVRKCGMSSWPFIASEEMVRGCHIAFFKNKFQKKKWKIKTFSSATKNHQIYAQNMQIHLDRISRTRTRVQYANYVNDARSNAGRDWLLMIFRLINRL